MLSQVVDLVEVLLLVVASEVVLPPAADSVVTMATMATAVVRLLRAAFLPADLSPAVELAASREVSASLAERVVREKARVMVVKPLSLLLLPLAPPLAPPPAFPLDSLAVALKANLASAAPLPLPLLDPLSLVLAARVSMRVKAETKEMVKASNASTLARSVPYRLRSPMGYLCSFVAFSLPSTYRLVYVCLWLLAQLQSKKK